MTVTRLLKIVFTTSLLFSVFAASALAADKNDKTIVAGFAPGPYSDMFKKAIKPGLEKKGYRVEIKEFSDYVQPNLALNNGSINVNLFQHRLYLDKFSRDKGLKLSPVITVPTAAVGLYSRKVKSLNQLKAGDEVTIPNDPTNLARALRLLQKNGLIKLRADVDATKASEKDIAENPKGIKIRPVEAAQLPRTLDSVALSAVNGNYAIAAGISLSSAIVLERLDENMTNLIAVRSEDLDKSFVKDIRAVVASAEFRKVIEDPRNPFKYFQQPEWFQHKK